MKLEKVRPIAFVASRYERRELERQNAKLPRELQPVPPEMWPGDLPDRLLRVWRSRDYLVMEYDEPAPVLVRLSVLRSSVDPISGRWHDGITWDELQRIKTECGYGSHDAVEIYPRDKDVVNVDNMRHIWVMREVQPFGWRA